MNQPVREDTEPREEQGAEPISRRQIVQLVVVLAIVVGAVAGAFVFFGGDSAQERTGGEGSVDGIVVSEFGGDGEIALASFTDKPLVVNFWASWCTFCIEEMPEFQEVYADVSGEVEFLGIDIQDQHDVARKLAKSTGVRYPLATDEDGSSFTAVDGMAMPTTLFIDEEGTILDRFSGPLTATQLRAKLSEHFGV